MATTMEWKVEGLVDNTVTGDVTAHWRVIGTSDQMHEVFGIDGSPTKQPYMATAYGTEIVGSTARSAVSEEEAVAAVQAAMGPEKVAEIESSVQRDIDGQINPTTVVIPLPWATNETPAIKA